MERERIGDALRIIRSDKVMLSETSLKTRLLLCKELKEYLRMLSFPINSHITGSFHFNIPRLGAKPIKSYKENLRFFCSTERK